MGSPGGSDDQPHSELDVAGVTHVVRPGETLYRISRAYGVSERELAELNDLDRPAELQVGRGLFIPGATRVLDLSSVSNLPPPRKEEEKAIVRDVHYAWPLHGLLVSRFGVRGVEHHDGIDIAAPEGTPVMAAGPGRVVFAGEQRGYGRLAVIDHGGGEATIYAHCSQVMVQVGDSVRTGQVIAKVGRTGRATGPHLHFEVRMHAQPRNPLFFLPDR
jgi:lipoprotein NlpD